MSDSLAPSVAPKRVPWWLWINVLSLDAPLLAILWQLALAHCHKVHLLPGCYTALGLAVWFVYIADRTLDGFCKADTSKLSTRHAFYRRNRFFFAFFVLPVVFLLLMFVALTDIPASIMWRGMFLGFAVCLYLLLYAARWNKALFITGNLIICAVVGSILWVFPIPMTLQIIGATVLGTMLLLSFGRGYQVGFSLLPKEIICGYLFALGCSLSVCFFTRDTSATPLSLETIMLALLCALNCIAIACYEREMDSANDPDAITQTWPQIIRVYPMLLITLAVVASMTLNQSLTRDLYWFVLSILISTGLLGALHAYSKRLSPELSHVLADVALVTPLLLFVIG